MRRETKYVDTDTFHFYNANPKNRITGDCAFRAIATALEQDYNQTVMEMAELMCKTGYALNDKKGIDKYLQSKGWVKRKQPKKADGTKYTGKEFCEYLQNHPGNVVAHIGGHHVVAFVSEDYEGFEHRCYDIWNPTKKCIGNYWVKGELT